MYLNSIGKSISTVLIAVFALAAAVIGQSDQGRIAGRVTDPNGAIVPGATVVIINSGTNEKRTVIGNDDGEYAASPLKAATYTVEVTAGSFAKKTVTNVQVAVGQQLNLDIPLSAQAETVSVDVVGGSETAINTSSAVIGATVNQREVRDLPLNGRQLSQLYLQAPGSVNVGTGTFGDIRFSGRSNEQNVVRYDGVEGSAIIDASPGNLNGEIASPFRLQSSLENVQEFKADSNNYPAEFGTGTGGQVSVVTKSGTNRFHGSAFEYFRNDSLDSRNFFDNVSAGIPKSKLRLNQFGGSIGGPIIKDKLFFFASYEGYRVRAGVNAVELAPSLSLALPGALIPGSSTPVSASVQPFIAGFRSAQALQIGPSAVSGLDIVQLQATEVTNEDAFFGRVDYKINDNHNVYFRYFQDTGKDSTPDGVSGRNTVLNAKPRNMVIAWSGIFRKYVNELRFGYNAAKTDVSGSAPTVNGIDWSKIIVNVSGTTASLGSNTVAGQGQSAGVSVPGGLVRANSSTNGRSQPYNPFTNSFIDNFSWTQGNHNFKIGGELRFVRMRTDRLGGTTYTFSNFTNFLSGSLQTTQFNGDLSDVSPFTGISGQRNAQQEYYIAFGQDEWRIKPGLTLNYGLRYEYYSPLREQHNGAVFFDIINGKLLDPAQPYYKTIKTNFGPRVALTWSPDVGGNGFFAGGRTVLRGGFGIYYGPGQTEDQIQPIESDRIGSTVSGGVFSGNPTADVSSIIAAFNANPNNRSYQPRAYSPDYAVPERVYQYSGSWQQELPGKFVSTIAYVGSIGHNLFLRSVANRILPGNTTIVNGANIPTGVGVVNRTNATGQVIGVNTIRQFSIVSGTTVQNPFAEIDYKTSGGHDRYNALQMSVSRSLTTGLTMNSQYTWSSSRGNTSGSNDARTSAQLENFDADEGRNNFDVRHSFNVSALYELPFGKGKQFDLGSSAANYVLGGWQIGGIFNARSGLPIEVLVTRPDVVVQCQQAGGCPNGAGGTFAQGFVANLPTFGASFPSLPTGFVAVVNTPGGGASRNVRRPDVISGVSFYKVDPTNDRLVINPAAFATPAPGTFGNLARNDLRGPQFHQFDLTFVKAFRITEDVHLQFRTEIFNVFNNTNFNAPSATLNNSLPTLSCTVSSGACTTYAATTSNVVQPGQAFTQGEAGGSFGLIRSTVARAVGLGTNRQIQFALRLTF